MFFLILKTSSLVRVFEVPLLKNLLVHLEKFTLWLCRKFCCLMSFSNNVTKVRGFWVDSKNFA